MLRSLIVIIFIPLGIGCASIDRANNSIHVKSFGLTRYNNTLSFGYLNIKEITIENTDDYNYADKPHCRVCGK